MKRRAKIIPFPLGTRRPPPPPRTEANLVEVRRCRDQAEALVVRSLLESHAIHAVLRGHLVHSIHPFSVGGQGEVAVLVAQVDALRARATLSRRRK